MNRYLPDVTQSGTGKRNRWKRSGKMKIGFIGLGNMATAMIGGMIKQEIVSAKDILGSARKAQTVKKAEDVFGITGC